MHTQLLLSILVLFLVVDSYALNVYLLLKNSTKQYVFNDGELDHRFDDTEYEKFITCKNGELEII